MKIAFIGNFQSGPGGEPADEVQIVREMKALGHEVYEIPRDEWREYVLEKFPANKYKVPEGITPELVIICKWHHFNEQTMWGIKEKYNCPIFYWCWDYMADGEAPDWHIGMAKVADLYLSGELGRTSYYRQNLVNFYYFQFDCADGQYPIQVNDEKIYDVVYLGSRTNQNGRMDLLDAINKEVPIQVFAYDTEAWAKAGYNVLPAVYGANFNRVVGQSKVVLGTSGGPNCFGYWSNRVGKVIHAGGRLLQQYTPGMELMLPDSVHYFATAEEAVAKLKKMVKDPAWKIPSPEERFKFTSAYRVKQLMILAERYLKGEPKAWLLP